MSSIYIKDEFDLPVRVTVNVWVVVCGALSVAVIVIS